MAVLVVLLGVVVALLGVLVAGLLRSHAEILRALHSLGADPDPPGRDVSPSGMSASTRDRHPPEAVDVSGETPRRDALAVAVAGADHDTLLAFLTSGCSTCGHFWEAFADPGAAQVPGDARLVIVTKDATAESPSQLARLAPSRVPVVMSSGAWEAYDVPVAPYFVYVHGPSSQVIGEEPRARGSRSAHCSLRRSATRGPAAAAPAVRAAPEATPHERRARTVT